ncbi:MAG: nucleotide pyrophosphatase [Myxococcales bacterium]|nr:nucleotide pyrophosphatase [Myxococcales bacterium]
MRRFLFSALAGLVLLTSCGSDREYRARPDTEKKLIILGIDGMDPVLVKRYIKEGRLPNIAKMIEGGSFLDLQTTDPPQSPVAWSAFITGLNLDGHGIYDFVHRDPVHLESYLSTSNAVLDDSIKGSICKNVGGHELLRGGDAFWQILEEEQIGASMVKIPANYPPAKSNANESMSGMGTPDILGTYGTFQMITDDPAWKDKHVSAGEIHMVDFSKSGVDKATLTGPGGGVTMDISIDREQKMAMIDLDGEKLILKAGEWSDWLPVDFGPGMLCAAEAHGMVRLYLRDVAPFRLYVSPTNADPGSSDWHISEPPSWSEEMAESIGRFYTQGMAEDTKALVGGVLSDDEFLAQATIVFEERIKMLHHELDTYEGGLLFFYFSSIDQQSHMYYGSMESDAPPQYAKYEHIVPELYERMDKVVGDALAKAGETPVVIMSDHGFAPWTWKVNLNTWLAQQGYLSVLQPDKMGKGILGHIDWENTQAYALGLNQLFLNLKGREAHGVVPPDEAEIVTQRLKRDLETWRFAETGERVVTKAMPAPVGQYFDRAPDLIVGYNRGFRSSDSSAMGAVGNETIERNEGHWNGDHCMYAGHVPGVLISSKPLGISEASLVDFAPTVLNYFGIKPPEGMKGNLLFESNL